MKYQFKNTDELIRFLNDNLLSTTETSKLLGISKARVGHLVRDNKLDVVKEQPKLFLKSIVIEKKKELEDLRKKYRPYD